MTLKMGSLSNLSKGFQLHIGKLYVQFSSKLRRYLKSRILVQYFVKTGFGTQGDPYTHENFGKKFSS